MPEEIERCPCCGVEGKLAGDEFPAGARLPGGTNWIWYNNYISGYECGECWLK